VAIYTGAKALSRWPINDESTLTVGRSVSLNRVIVSACRRKSFDPLGVSQGINNIFSLHTSPTSLIESDGVGYTVLLLFSKSKRLISGLETFLGHKPITLQPVLIFCSVKLFPRAFW
jgi:hypothetical protein